MAVDTTSMAKTLTDVLLKLRKSTIQAINVAELGQVIDIISTPAQTLYKCELLNNSAITIVCDKIREVDITIGIRVVILFTDTDFRNNMLKIRSGGKSQSVISTELHSSMYGIIIGTIGT